jgi:hypothetical protein
MSNSVAAQSSSHAQLQLSLSLIYVLVCAFRSFFPRIDLERYCLFDNALSSIVLGRTAATVAEMAFSIQCAALVSHLAAMAPLDALSELLVSIVANGLVPAVAVAQMFCWHSTLTLNFAGHAIEESIWAASQALVGVVLALVWRQLPDECSGTMLSYGLAAGVVGELAYVLFMVRVDIPMYVSRWHRDQQTKKKTLSLGAGFIDALTRRERTWHRHHWREEFAWLTAYFSVAVWISIAMAYVPTHCI